MNTRRAARVTAPGVITLETIDDAPPPGPGEVAVELVACGVCGSNLHHLNRPELVGADRRDSPGAMGHEMVGRVSAVGPDVTTHEVGDPVALEPQLAAACGECAGCASGQAWFCTRPRPLPVWGFADRLVVRARGAWRLPPELDLLVATLVEPVAVSVHALRVTTTAMSRDDDLGGVKVVVLGAGAMGLLTVAAARHLGCDHVVCVARHEHQARLAARLGAHRVLMDGDPDLDQTLTELAPGLVVECVGGSADTFDRALRIAGPAGEISVMGLFDVPQQVRSRAVFRRQLRVVFPVVYGELRGRHDFGIAVELLRGSGLPFGELLTDRFPLADIGAAFAAAASKSSGAIRVLVGRTERDLAPQDT
ncbi:zinc-binding dehydrogenase [Streptomyces sp. NPDC090075]|uniref:zinc-dependent alcohol dehydrogenase n=1 Tax=Streptomyces sp. NPDC090075 TaxID=3365937 RepID=UPI0037F158C7